MEKYVNTRLLRQIKDRKFDFGYLSDHPDLSIEVIAEYPTAPWDWESIITHDNMCLRWLLELPDAPWIWSSVPNADRWTFDWVRKLPDAPWEWSEMHHEDGFCMCWVAEFPDKPWNMFYLSGFATMDLLKRFPHIHWNWNVVTSVSPIKPSEMAENPGLPWDFTDFAFESVDDNDIDFLRMFRDQFNHDAWIDFTEHAEWSVIRKYPDLPWAWSEIEPEDMEEDDIQMLRDHEPSINWNKMSLLVPYRIIKKNLDLPWSAEWVSMNDTLTFDDLDDTFNWDYSFVPCEPIERVVRKWVAANLIKRRFKRAISDPMYTMCINRLEREGEELTYLC
jgi:hypothetical protein